MKIDAREDHGQVILTLHGKLAGAWVASLEECWKKARLQNPNRNFSIELTGVTSVDQSGWYLLQLMHRDGVSFIARGLMNEDIKDRITCPKV